MSFNQSRSDKSSNYRKSGNRSGNAAASYHRTNSGKSSAGGGGGSFKKPNNVQGEQSRESAQSVTPELNYVAAPPRNVQNGVRVSSRVSSRTLLQQAGTYSNLACRSSSSFSNAAGTSGGVGRGPGRKEEPSGGRGRGDSSSNIGKDKIDALGRLLIRILRHMAAELNLSIRSDGYLKVNDLLKLNLKTHANNPLRSHSFEDVREVVRRDNKQRFSLMEEEGELFIRANQGHTIKEVESESLLKPITSPEEVPVCVHGTYNRNLDSILQSGLKRMKRLHVHFSSGLPTDGGVISGMRRDVNVLIFLDVQKALADGMMLYISDNKVILTKGFEDMVPVKYFEKVESWPDRRPIPLN